MKKFLTVGNIVKVAAFVFGFVAFFMMLTDQVYTELLGNKLLYEANVVLFGSEAYVKPATISLVGYIFILIGALGACGTIFLKLDKKTSMIINICITVLMILGAIFVFVVGANFYKVNGGEDNNPYHLASGPIVGGVFGLFAALLLVLSSFVPNKKLVK
ncbi:MAG: hypothetical protein K5765_05135 [Clostridia bacterium]|nr:hypothetical protein [Clostridia bacterium]